MKKRKLRKLRAFALPYRYMSTAWLDSLHETVTIQSSILEIKDAKKLHAWLGKAIAYLEQERK